MCSNYESPLSRRYASKEMLHLFSPQMRIQTWRSLWTELARVEHELGLPISLDQVQELENHIADIDFDLADAREKEVHHDVVAHIYAYGICAPSAAKIIHLGATSCYVTDNGDLILYRKAFQYLRDRLVSVINILSRFANTYKALPTIGYTHYQPAQLVTVGKRAALWLQDFYTDLEELDYFLDNLKFLGCRGSTGTEASLLELFDGDSAKVDQLNRKLCETFGFKECFPITAQTYPRKVDSRILFCLSSIGQSCYRMANDIRLLQHDLQLEEQFAANQVGSSSMPYKRNPMYCERICSLSRYIMVNAQNAPLTASNQWLERTLDDSANRRLVLPDCFLCADAILLLVQKIAGNLQVNEVIIKQAVNDYLPFISTEVLLMESVKKGGDRQQLHELMRTVAMDVVYRQKDGQKCNYLDLLATHPEFPLSAQDIQTLLTPEMHIGRCVEQVDTFLEKIQITLLSGVIPNN